MQFQKGPGARVQGICKSGALEEMTGLSACLAAGSVQQPLPPASLLATGAGTKRQSENSILSLVLPETQEAKTESSSRGGSAFPSASGKVPSALKGRTFGFPGICHGTPSPTAAI